MLRSSDLLAHLPSRRAGGRLARAVVTSSGRALVRAGDRFIDAEAYRLSASLSFYALSSIFPLMLLALSLGKLVLGDSPTLQNALISALNATHSAALRSLLEDTLRSLRGSDAGDVPSLVIGIVASVFAASGMFLELDAAMAKIFRVPEWSAAPWRSVRATIKVRATALLLVIFTSVLLLCGTVLLTAVEAVATQLPWFARRYPGAPTALAAVGLTVLTLGLCYRIVPDVRVPWRAAWLGSIIAGFALHAVRWPLGFVVAHVTNYSAYGVVGTLLLLLTWLYVASCILLYGAALAATARGTGPGLRI